MDLQDIQRQDPLIRLVEKQSGNEALSPMDPPDAYEPPAKEAVAAESMHPFLQSLIQEHESLTEALTAFETALAALQEEGVTQAVHEQIRTFFQFFDQASINHHRKEERVLFPLLRKRLIEHGEHSQGPEKTTAVEVLEDDHIKTLQQVALIFNFFGLAFRLQDETSRLLVLDAALQQGKMLVEDVRLHIFREENIVFPLAHKYITVEEFDTFSAYNSA